MEYKNIISLGGNCFVALNIKDLGLRNMSGPFDWLTSFDFHSVLELIANHFQGFLDNDSLSQYSNNKAFYHNDRYDIGFYHDFNKFISLQKQLKKVDEKYQRRIDRFYRSIKQPTLFVRYIATLEDLEFIGREQAAIVKTLKSFNENNDIVFCSHFEGCEQTVQNCYFVAKDDGKWYTTNPILNNESFKKYLLNIEFSNREENINFNKNDPKKQSIMKKYGILAAAEYYSRKLLNKPYTHCRQHFID